MSLTLTPVFTELATPNSNPLDPANWATPVGNYHFQALNGAVQAVNLGFAQDTLNVYNGAACNNDQYTKVKVHGWVPGNFQNFTLVLRTSIAGTTGYEFSAADNGDGLTTYFQVIGSSGAGILYSTNVPNIIVGDTFTFAIIGTQIYAYYNSSLLYTAPNMEFASGVPGLGLTVYTALTDATLVPVTVGNASGFDSLAYSQPDCRTTKPNSATSRFVNATLIYDAQTSSNPAEPPTDSRKAGALVASGMYPQNSRTPGTYGPGNN